MIIPLDEFEHIIDENILQRGYDYYGKGYVVDLIEVEPGEYEGIVTGTTNYSVFLSLRENAVTRFLCNCQYDAGPVCKHVVAVIFSLQQDRLLPIEKLKEKGIKKSTSVSRQVKEILNKLSAEEIKSFVQETAKNNKEFRNLIFGTYGHFIEGLSKEFFQQQIRSILNAAGGRGGFISWNDMPVVVRNLSPILERTGNDLEKENFRNVFYLNTALLEEMTAALDYADDSNGDIGYHINFAMEMLNKLAEEDLPEALRKDLFNYGLSTYKSNIFSGWDWHLDMLGLAKSTIRTEAEADIVLKVLDSVSDDFDLKQAQWMQFCLLKEYKGTEKSREFIETHITNPDLRRYEIERTIRENDFNQAIGLCNAGIEHDKKERPGLVTSWQNYLLKIAQAQNDLPGILKYARNLYLANFSNEQDYYMVLKDNVKEEDWPAFLEELINEINTFQGWRKDNMIKEIYIREEWWDRLFAQISQNPSLGEIESAEAHLAKDYSRELVQLYAEAVVVYLEQNVGRKHYRTICRYLRRMKKLGGEQEQQKLVNMFMEIYNRRPALIEELKRV